MDSTERRFKPRKEIAIPLRFRIATTNNAGMEAGQTVNVSENGMYFVLDHSLIVGSQLEMFITLPNELTGKGSEEVRCTGRVVHVEPQAGPNGRSGIGVQIERFESVAASKWAS